MEYAQQNVPKPTQRKKWKQDISHLQKIPGTHIVPQPHSDDIETDKKRQSPEKSLMKEFRLLEDKRELYISEVDKIKREFRK